MRAVAYSTSRAARDVRMAQHALHHHAPMPVYIVHDLRTRTTPFSKNRHDSRVRSLPYPFTASGSTSYVVNRLPAEPALPPLGDSALCPSSGVERAMLAAAAFAALDSPTVLLH